MSDQVCRACGARLLDETVASGLCPACLLACAIDLVDSDQEPQAPSFAPGTVIGSFRITRLLGTGGMATVYEAHDAALDRAVALKVLPRELLHDGTFRQRFQQEARIIAGLEHPNIVPIYAAGIDDGTPWLSMRLVPGGTVAGAVGSPIPLPRALPILCGVADALDYAHARGVIHRDVKPSNILLDGSGHVSVADFGLARLTSRDSALTSSGIVIGTADYIAPEQAVGAPLDHRCDVYSLGVVAYELLTGVKPFGGPSAIAVLTRHVNDPVPIPSRSCVPERTMRVVLKALEKQPQHRWPTAKAFVDALEASARPDQPMRSKFVALVAAAAVVALGMWLVITAIDPSFRPAPSLTGPVEMRPVAPDWAPFRAAVVATPPIASDRVLSRGPSVPDSRLGSHASNVPESPIRVQPTDDRESVVSSAGPTGVTSPGSKAAAERTFEPDNVTAPALLPPAANVAPSVAEDVIVRPRRISAVDPIYPQMARAAQLEGDVVLEARVGADGRVLDARVVRSAHRVFDEPARKAILQYKYFPQLRNGRPEPTTVEEKVSFRFTK